MLHNTARDTTGCFGEKKRPINQSLTCMHASKLLIFMSHTTTVGAFTYCVVLAPKAVIGRPQSFHRMRTLGLQFSQL